MKSLRTLGIAEQIVALFEDRVTEGTRWAIQHPLHLTDEQFDQSIARARDLGVESGLRITPIYEREGWWTCDPTQRIASLAVHETLKRNLGEAERHARVYAEFGKLDSFCEWHGKQVAGTITAYLSDIAQIDVSAGADYVLARVDQAIAAGKGYVERNGVAT